MSTDSRAVIRRALVLCCLLAVWLFCKRVNLQFRAKYFNILNHTNFGDPNTTAGGSSFGRITRTSPQSTDITNDPRIAQFSLKLAFREHRDKFNFKGATLFSRLLSCT